MIKLPQFPKRMGLRNKFSKSKIIISIFGIPASNILWYEFTSQCGANEEKKQMIRTQSYNKWKSSLSEEDGARETMIEREKQMHTYKRVRDKYWMTFSIRTFHTVYSTTLVGEYFMTRRRRKKNITKLRFDPANAKRVFMFVRVFSFSFN